ncbi:MAG: hypothetical protein LBF90_04250 [Prevotellaceae bacterium]|jgi:hypothetical protein|nr:hypothetical protein [Prevotellaceae bacterium]
MFTGLKRAAGRRVLRKKSRQLHCLRRFHNFHTAKTVALLYPYSKTTDSQIDKFIRFFTEQRIKVQALGYIAETDVPKSFIATMTKNLFCKRHLNWYNRPSSGEINTFIETPFDILIDFSPEPLFPLHYIATLSHAAMRVGRSAYPGNPYEFRLEMPACADSHAYGEQLLHYLLSIQIK